MKSNFHVPVLLNEAIEGLNIKDGGIYVDLTLGRAGHSSEILKRLSKGRLICIDQDEEAIKYSKTILDGIGGNYKIVKSNFKSIKKVLQDENVIKIDGALYDLGVSSPQFDEDYRGFSYNNDGPLDMRMDLDNPLTAYKVVNTYDLKELTRIFKEYGEEKYSYSIAKNIIKIRTVKSIESTFELVDIIKKSKPAKELAKKGHPAKQVFQALRIEVNNELDSLKISLEEVIKSLNINGRVVVITFQSLEDRIVKTMFKKYSVVYGDRLNDYLLPKDLKTPDYKEINKSVILPTANEIEENRRSKSAKLRILERIK